MKNIKKLLCVLMSLTICLTVVSCSNSSNDDDDDYDKTTDTDVRFDSYSSAMDSHYSNYDSNNSNVNSYLNSPTLSSINSNDSAFYSSDSSFKRVNTEPSYEYYSLLDAEYQKYHINSSKEIVVMNLDYNDYNNYGYTCNYYYDMINQKIVLTYYNSYFTDDNDSCAHIYIYDIENKQLSELKHKYSIASETVKCNQGIISFISTELINSGSDNEELKYYAVRVDYEGNEDRIYLCSSKDAELMDLISVFDDGSALLWGKKYDGYEEIGAYGAYINPEFNKVTRVSSPIKILEHGIKETVDLDYSSSSYKYGNKIYTGTNCYLDLTDYVWKENPNGHYIDTDYVQCGKYVFDTYIINDLETGQNIDSFKSNSDIFLNENYVGYFGGDYTFLLDGNSLIKSKIPGNDVDIDHSNDELVMENWIDESSDDNKPFRALLDKDIYLLIDEYGVFLRNFSNNDEEIVFVYKEHKKD